MNAGENKRRGSVVARALWIAVLLLAARALLVFGLDHFVQGRALELARSRLAWSLPSMVVRASFLGFAVALITAAAGAPRRKAWQRPVLVLIGTFFVAAFGAGWLQEDPSRALGTGTERGLQALAAVTVAAGVFTILCTFLAPHRAGFVPLPAAVLAGTALLLGTALAGPALLRPERGPMELREVVLEVLATEPTWEDPVHVATLSPAVNFRLRGADMVSLVLPPPSEATLAPLELNASARLIARAGIDRSVFWEPDLEGHRVRFELELDGTVAFAHEIPIEGVGQYGESEWVDVGGPQGLEVAPGTTLTLRTELLDPDGASVNSAVPLQAGFGGLTCERRWTAPRESASLEQPNIVVVVMDTERADRLSAYGYPRPTSPNLERLAERGTLFETAYAAGSWTWPSTASLLTGLLPAQHGVDSYTSCTLANSLDTLPEVLQREGYSTAAWSANPLIVPDKNFDQGFEHFERGGNSPRATETFFPLALDWLRLNADKRFFLWLQLMDVHTPRRPHPEGRALLAGDVPAEFHGLEFVDLERAFQDGGGHSADGGLATEKLVDAGERQWFSDLYDASVWSGDRWLGLLLDELEALGLDENTIVVFTSDHGEEIFEHGLAGHAQSLFPELTRVPLVLAGPGIAAGQRITTPLSNRHLAPTLARLGGARLTAAGDAFDLVTGLPEAAPDTVLFATTQGWWNGVKEQPLLGLREGPWELHWAPDGGDWGATSTAGGQWRLYDVVADPHLQQDRATSEAAVAERLRTRLAARIAELEALRDVPLQSAGAATLDMLREMGYIDE